MPWRQIVDTYSVAHAYFNIMKFLPDQKVSLFDVLTSTINERRKGERVIEDATQLAYVF